MPKTAVITARVEPEVKAEAEKIFSEMGLTMSQAMNMYLRQVINRRAIPFELRADESKKDVQFLKSLAGVVNSGYSDTSERVEELVTEAVLQKHEKRQ